MTAASTYCAATEHVGTTDGETLRRPRQEPGRKAEAGRRRKDEIMAHVAHHAPTASRLSDATGVVSWFAGLGERFGQWRLYRRTLNELGGLNDRELQDLGLHRSALQSVAWHAVYDR
jgi:uncharacterized protein YjiS (DUF1127 family)